MEVAVGVFGVLMNGISGFVLLGGESFDGGVCHTVTFFNSDSRKTSSSIHVLTTSGSSDTLISMVRAFLAIGV